MSSQIAYLTRSPLALPLKAPFAYEWMYALQHAVRQDPVHSLHDHVGVLGLLGDEKAGSEFGHAVCGRSICLPARKSR